MLLCLIELLLGIGLESNLAYLLQVVDLGAVGRRMVRLHAAERSVVPTCSLSAAAVLPLALLGHHARARRVADYGTTIVHLAAQVLVGAIEASAVQPLVRLLARVRLRLLGLIQDIL